MLIVTSYFLTAAISAVSGFQIIGSLIPSIEAQIVILASLGVLALATINTVVTSESPTVAQSLTDTAMKPVMETG